MKVVTWSENARLAGLKACTTSDFCNLARSAAATSPTPDPSATRLLSSRALQPLVILLALEAELVDEFRVGLDALRQADGERLRVDLRVVDRQLDLERPEVR